jgi:hypothetical protein
MLLVLDLLWRGYHVVLSTHSPLVLTVAWMLRRLRETNARWQRLCDGFGIPMERRRDLRPVAEAALTKDVRTYLLSFGEDGMVNSKDISSLDPGDEEDDVAGWGGLTGFSSRFGDAVRQAVLAGVEDAISVTSSGRPSKGIAIGWKTPHPSSRSMRARTSDSNAVGATIEALMRRPVAEVSSYRVAMSLGSGSSGSGRWKKSILTRVSAGGAGARPSGSIAPQEAAARAVRAAEKRGSLARRPAPCVG